MSPYGWNLLFLKYEEVWANLMTFPKAQLISLVHGGGPMPNQGWSQERSYFSCLQTRWNSYVSIQHTAETKKVINEPTNKSKVLPKAPTMAVWEEALGGVRRADVQQAAPRDPEPRVPWNSQYQNKNGAPAVSFGQPAAVGYLNKCFSVVTQSVYLLARCIEWVLRKSIWEK